MKVLHLPENIASFISETVVLQNRYGDMKAKGVVYSDEVYSSVDYEGVEVRKKHNYEIKYRPKWFLVEAKRTMRFIRDILWADVIHWYWSDQIFQNNFDYKLIRFLRKPIVVEWLGSEIRIHDIEHSVNAYYAKECAINPEIIPLLCNAKSMELQQKFAKLNAIPVLVRGASILYHVRRELFREVRSTRHRINLDKYQPRLIDKSNAVPLIVHAPTDTNIKGTLYIREAIDVLKREGLSFEFRLLQNMKREEVKECIAGCDIFIDQLICGGYGMSATEAMALGKPVICYMHDTSLREMEMECPLINANPDTITGELRKLILDPEMRYNKAKESREFVLNYYNPDLIHAELREAYLKAMN